ncbi:transport and Golgi organization protein 2 homolog [Asterias rubens]|uniref:transport and Golgi organization protein 2 homolog n=1 Tax=Asterias rubens TaxID=7604 RepID=UPI001455A21A|nr:transport and Golgi organization protein 2 homolog [Asterias rubens]XP_033627312.1 transport and Golgi organization protein 2 homolog [Asterias rubens]
MCLTALFINPHPVSGEYKLILVFNRDEFYARPTKEAEFWQRNPNIISGQDMFVGKEGGTWLGVSRMGRFAMLLNILQPGGLNPDAKGRGSLVSDFIQGSMDGQTYLKDVAKESALYNGFNLITMEFRKDGEVNTNYFTNRASELPEPVKIEPGVQVFSNHPVTESWPKTDYVRSEFEKIVKRVPGLNKDNLIKELIAMMSLDKPLITDVDISNEMLDVQKRKVLKELVFIKSSNYGTRTTTVILIDAEGTISFTERTLKEPIDSKNPEWQQKTHAASML